MLTRCTPCGAAVLGRCCLCFPMQRPCFSSLASQVLHLNLYLSIRGELVWLPAPLCCPSCCLLHIRPEMRTESRWGMVLLHEMQTVLSHLCVHVTSLQQTHAVAVELHPVNSCVFSFLLCQSGQGKHACISVSCNALSFYGFSCEVAVQIRSNKSCYLKAPTLHRISKSLLFGASGKQPWEELTAWIQSHAKTHLSREQAGTGPGFSKAALPPPCQPWGPSTDQGATLHPHRDSSPLRKPRNKVQRKGTPGSLSTLNSRLHLYTSLSGRVQACGVGVQEATSPAGLWKVSHLYLDSILPLACELIKYKNHFILLFLCQARKKKK